MKVVLIEDSRLARAEMRRLLKAHEDVEIIGEAANADEAERLLSAVAPDLAFLDIQMPGRNGFDLLASLERAPYVIFCTAYSEFAIRAFERNALDYLLKPVERERLAQSLDRARATLRLNGPKQTGKESLTAADHIFVKDGENCWFVKLSDVRLFEVEGSYTRIYFASKRPLVLRTLNYLEERLDPRSFFRVSRRHLVNLAWIANVEPWISGGLQLTLKDGEKVEVSRRQAQRLREVLTL